MPPSNLSEAQAWARDNCVKSHGDVAAGAVIGGILGAIVGGFYSAEACLYLAAAIFAVQALVIWLSPAVALDRQPEMVGDEATARC